MNITLRKANAVQNSINEAIRTIKVETNLELNEFQNVEAEIAAAQKKLEDADLRREKLLVVLYNIRGLVGQANATSGIDLKLARAAYVDKRIGQLEALANVNAVTSLDVIKGKLEKIKSLKDEARSRIYGYGDTVSTSILSQDKIDAIQAEVKNLKKQKQKLNDEILELNIKTEIPLSDDAVQVLQAEGLV
jgi:uncharacterized protein YdcH (DUF465 family)